MNSLSFNRSPPSTSRKYKAINIIVDNAYEVPVFFPTLSNVHRTYVVSDDWQLYGSCQGVDSSKVAITTAKK